MNKESLFFQQATQLGQSMKDAGHILDFEVRQISSDEVDLLVKPVKTIEFINISDVIQTNDPHQP